MNKFIFLDIDGTLVDDQKVIPPTAKDAIRQAKEKGHKLIVATGRANKGVIPEIRELGFDGYIFSAGAVVEFENQTIHKQTMDPNLVSELIKAMEENDIGYILEGYQYSYYDQRFLDYLLKKRTIEELDSTGSRFQPKDSYRHGETDIFKIAFFAQDMAHSKAFEETMQDCKEIFIFTHQQVPGDLINGEITNANVTKASGIKRLMKHAKKPMANTISFGDSLNDLEMLKLTETGICMDNGVEELKEVADDITDSPAKDGIYKAFVKHGLI